MLLIMSLYSVVESMGRNISISYVHKGPFISICDLSKKRQKKQKSKTKQVLKQA